MDELTVKEIVKAFAYGYSASQIATLVEEKEADVLVVEKDHATEIETKKTELKEGGWF